MSDVRTVLGASVGWIGISMVSDGVPTLLLPYRLSLAGETDATSVGLVALVGLGLAALVQPFAGALSDRVGRFLVIGVGLAVATGGLLLLVVPGPLATAMTAVVVVLVGASIMQAGQQPLLPDAVRHESRGLASGAKGAFDVGGALLGFLLLGLLLGAGSFVPAVASVGVVLAAGAAAAWLLLRGERARHAGGPTAQPAASPSPTSGGDGERRAALVGIVLARFLFLLGVFAVGRFLFVYVADRFGLAPEAAAAEAGLVLLVLASATVAASVPFGWLADRVGRRPVMLFGGAVGAAGIAAIPLASGSVPLLGAGLLVAAASASFGAASWAMLSDLTARSRHDSRRESGKLLGLANVGTAGAAAAAGLFGPIIDAGNSAGRQAGYATAFSVAALCTLAGGLLAWRWKRDFDPVQQAPPSLEVPS